MAAVMDFESIFWLNYRFPSAKGLTVKAYIRRGEWRTTAPLFDFRTHLYLQSDTYGSDIAAGKSYNMIKVGRWKYEGA